MLSFPLSWHHIFTAVHIENIICFLVFFAGVATFPCLINFSEQRGSLRFCFLLFSCILSASHSMILARASLESLPKLWENRGWRNSFHASWIQHFLARWFALPVLECEISCCDVLTLSSALSLCLLLSLIHLRRFFLVLFFMFSFSHKRRFTPTQALNYFFVFTASQ